MHSCLSSGDPIQSLENEETDILETRQEWGFVEE